MRHRVLVVDDDDINVEIMAKLLQDDCELAVARCGEECLRTIDEFRPGLVLLDIMMPGMDGYETCRRIKSSPEADLVQVVLVSAKASTTERLKGYEVGADDYLVKPFDHDELLAKVRIHFRLRDALESLGEAHAALRKHNDQLELLVAQRTAQIIARRDGLRFGQAGRLARSRDR